VKSIKVCYIHMLEDSIMKCTKYCFKKEGEEREAEMEI
jgi:hypothetical protein